MRKKRTERKRSAALKTTASSKASTAIAAGDSTSIQIKRPFLLPDYVRAALQTLTEAGWVSYVVGGSVRDFLLKIEAKDHDIATSAPPEELKKLFPDALSVGAQFGVAKVPVKSHTVLEVATFRKDGRYKDFRHPTHIETSDPKTDAARRDFSINGLFYDPKTNRIIDYVGGISDIKKKVVRAIGNPMERFHEDALRLLRAVRFTSSLGFKLDAPTARAIVRKADLLKKISAERIRDEMTLILESPRPDHALKLCSETGILKVLLPELEALKGVEQSPLYKRLGSALKNGSAQTEDIWSHKLKMLKIFRERNPYPSSILSWAVLLHDIGKPKALKQSDGQNFNGHEKMGASMARKICSRLKMSRIEMDTIESIVSEHTRFHDVFGMRESTLQRWLMQPYFEDLLALHEIDAICSDGNLAFFEFCQKKLEEMSRRPISAGILTGKDLIQLGLKPGPRFSVILRVIEDLALERKLNNKEEALEFVVKHFVD